MKRWWTWSGSNRRPLPCHFPQRIVAVRHRARASDTKRQCSCGFNACSLPLTYARPTRRELFRHGQGWEGYDTSHDTRKFAGQLPPSRLPSAVFPEHRSVISVHARYACAHGSAQHRSESTVSALYACRSFCLCVRLVQLVLRSLKTSTVRVKRWVGLAT